MNDATPIRYDIVFDVDIGRSLFKGKEVVETSLPKKTKSLTLNSADLKINSCSVEKDGEIVVCGHKINERYQTLRIDLPKAMLGSVNLMIDFEGALNERLAGFYRSTYKDAKGNVRHLATTQFEAADARRAFPCWDSPDKKAVFSIKMVVDKKLTAISNMPVKSEKALGVHSAKKIVSFHDTPIMSTYLVYLGVGDFEFVEDRLGKTMIRVAATPGNKHRCEMALQFAKRFLDFYQKYFGIPYPLPKMDLIAVPDFASGAMENWGAITFRETALFFDEKTSSTSTKQRIADVIAHEIAHHWFGNLVTMKWWNDLWLNESFATFIGTKATNDCFPEWDVWAQFMNMDVAAAFRLDSLKSSHKIEVEVDKPAEIGEIFDEISYQKGGSVLKMLYNYLGEEKFRKGLSAYLKRHSYSNATTDDLWRSLSESSGVPVKSMMDTWIRQTGYPVVDVSASDGKISLKQSRFILDSGSGGKQRWIIPITARIGKSAENFLMKSRKMSMGKSNSPIKLNLGQHGFYRVSYSDDIMEDLKAAVENRSLDEVDRWGLQNDMFNLCLAGRRKFRDYLSMVEAYEGEKSYLVLRDILDNLYSVYNIAALEKFSENIKSFNRKFFRKHFERLGWEPVKGEPHTDSMLRPYLILALGVFGDEEILEESARRFKLFLEKPESLHPDIRGAIYSLAAWQGDDRTHEQIQKMYMNAETQEQAVRFLLSLASFKDKALLRKTLGFALSQHVRTQDMFMPISATAGNPYGKEIAWPWIKENWKRIVERHGGLGQHLIGRIVESLGSMAEERREREVRAFFRKNPTPGTEMAVRQTLENIRIHARFLQGLRKEFSKGY
jgi:tricorn protease interacting factor F2/3